MTHRALDTKTRILDAAEKLFGDKGFDTTSLRDITTEADVNLASVNYHFQSKDSLIDAVIARRVEPINKKRREMLAAGGAKSNRETDPDGVSISPDRDQDISAGCTPDWPHSGNAGCMPDSAVQETYGTGCTTIHLPLFKRLCPI